MEQMNGGWLPCGEDPKPGNNGTLQNLNPPRSILDLQFYLARQKVYVLSAHWKKEKKAIEITFESHIIKNTV